MAGQLRLTSCSWTTVSLNAVKFTITNFPSFVIRQLLLPKDSYCAERYTACHWLQKAHTPTHFHTLHTLCCLKDGLPECVRNERKVTRQILHKDLYEMLSTTASMKPINGNFRLARIVSILSVCRGLFQRHVPALPGDEWPKIMSVGTAG